jgi:hypothetical protein
MESRNQIQVWLKKLEQESWQLELLVSGFTIFLLQMAYQAITEYGNSFQFHHESSSYLFIIAALLLYILSICTLVLIINLVLHLAFRGFWIGAIGLRSVGANINYDKLSYTDFFTEKLKKSVISMDDLIVRLDRVCSVIFSFTFLIIFLFLSLFLFLMILTLGQLGLQLLVTNTPGWLSPVLKIASTIVTIALLVSGLAYLIDSLSLGLLKKSRRLRPVYYPIYRLLSTVTLSFLYRTIYYNIITKFPVSYTRLILIAYMIIIFFVPFITFDDYRYFPDNETSSSMYAEYYDDTREEDAYISKVSMPSMAVSDSFIPLFIRYNPSDNPALEKCCPNFSPAKGGGFKHGISFTREGITLSAPSVEETDPEAMLNCLLDFYTLKIDNVKSDVSQALFYTHPNKGEKGVLLLINTDHLINGPHKIELSKPILQDSVLEIKEYANIQFWKQ